MKITDFIAQLRSNSESIAFQDTMACIEKNYVFTETAFQNGETFNEAGTNSGSCKLFAFAKENSLSVEETLACFGDYYRKDVLENPEGTDHANIRNFIQSGWKGIDFKGQALTKR